MENDKEIKNEVFPYYPAYDPNAYKEINIGPTLSMTFTDVEFLIYEKFGDGPMEQHRFPFDMHMRDEIHFNEYYNKYKNLLQKTKAEKNINEIVVLQKCRKTTTFQHEHKDII
jgi:hypothetical protein